MCKNLTSRIKAIETAKASTPHVVEVYDTYDGQPDLVALIEVIDESYAFIKSVNRFGELEHYRTIPHWDNPSRNRIADLCDVDRRFCRIVA